MVRWKRSTLPLVCGRLLHELVAVLAAGLAWRLLPVLAALLLADEPPATAVRDVAELLDVHVQQVAGMLLLVAARTGSPVAR